MQSLLNHEPRGKVNVSLEVQVDSMCRYELGCWLLLGSNVKIQYSNSNAFLSYATMDRHLCKT